MTGEEIKATKLVELQDLRNKVSQNPNAIKAVDFVMEIEHYGFWKEYKDNSAMQIMDKFLKGGLLVKGWQHDERATIVMATGVITITWTEIVQDGKGGHKATRTRTL